MGQYNYRTKEDGPPSEGKGEKLKVSSIRQDDWSFLERITDAVSKLPKETQQSINQMGKALNHSGVVFAGVSSGSAKQQTGTAKGANQEQQISV
jgi:hypothetical protein